MTIEEMLMNVSLSVKGISRNKFEILFIENAECDIKAGNLLIERFTTLVGFILRKHRQKKKDYIEGNLVHFFCKNTYDYVNHITLHYMT